MSIPFPSDDALDKIETLLTRSVDAVAGFEMMAKKAKPEFRPTAKRFLQTHRDHVSDLSDILSECGREPVLDGSFMSSVNASVVSLRALFDEIDNDVMNSIKVGERPIINIFDELIMEAGLNYDTSEFERMRSELLQLTEEKRQID